MPTSTLDNQESSPRVLVWHQGALGDLLLSGPALVAVHRHNPGMRFTGVGHPERWRLLSPTLPLEQIWDSGEGIWAPLFMEDAPLPPALRARLALFGAALVFSPQPRPLILERLGQAGLPRVVHIPTIPEAPQPAWKFQADYLAALGLAAAPTPLRLKLPPELQAVEPPEVAGAGPWVVIGPGSGSPRKNWPLDYYWELSRSLNWELQARVIWLAGPAEAPRLPFLRGLIRAQGFALLESLPLPQVAAVLSKCRLYVGGDSGLTHLAAAAGAPKILALFGPTDPRIWAPSGDQVVVLTPAEEPGGVGFSDLPRLSFKTVLEAAGRLLAA